MDRLELLNFIRAKFDDNEVRELCFALNIDYESLPGEGKAAKTRELVALCERRDRLPELERAAQHLAQAPGPAVKRPGGSGFNQSGQTVEKQINVNGDYIEYNLRGDGDIIGDHSRSTVIKGQTPDILDAPDLKRALAEVQRHLGQNDKREMQELLDVVRQWRDSDAAALSELRGMVDGLRRAFKHLQARDLPDMDRRLREAIAEVTEVVKANADVGTGLELTLPLIPLLLDYKLNLDLGSGLDLRQAWENLRERLMRG